jgi:hypothetical protein
MAEPGTEHEIFDDDSGRWQVATRASIYLLDLDQRTC